MEKITKVFLIRHGECDGNAENRFRGRVDFPLNENGRAQAKAAAEALAAEKIDIVYSSPLSRAMETARAIAAPHSASVLPCEGFNNMSLGVWENTPKAEIEKKFPEEWKLWLEAPEELSIENAESCDGVKERAFSALRGLTEKHAGKTLAVVSHRGVLKPLIAAALGISKPYMWRVRIDNAAFSELVHSPVRGWTLIRSNCSEHLKGLKVIKEFN